MSGAPWSFIFPQHSCLSAEPCSITSDPGCHRLLQTAKRPPGTSLLTHGSRSQANCMPHSTNEKTEAQGGPRWSLDFGSQFSATLNLLPAPGSQTQAHAGKCWAVKKMLMSTALKLSPKHWPWPLLRSFRSQVPATMPALGMKGRASFPCAVAVNTERQTLEQKPQEGGGSVGPSTALSLALRAETINIWR